MCRLSCTFMQVLSSKLAVISAQNRHIRQGLTIVFTIGYLLFYGQSVETVSLSWSEPGRAYINEMQFVDYLNCNECDLSPETEYVPIYHQVIELPAGASGAIATLIDVEYTAMTPAEVEIAKENSAISNEFAISSTTTISRGVTYAIVEVATVRKAFGRSGFEKLISANIVIEPSYGGLRNTSRAMSFAANSVLANGDWYKIGVQSTGVFKLDYNTLQSLGIDMTMLMMDEVNIYGNGEGILPENNSTYRHDDLKLNAIEAVDNNLNGQFDNDDYYLFYAVGPDTWKDAGTTFTYENNYYTDTAFYFIGINIEPANRVVTLSQTLGGADVTSFSERAHHEYDNVNLIKSGRTWYGEKFDIVTNYTISFNVPNIDQSASAQVYISTVSHNTGGPETMNVTVNSGIGTGIINYSTIGSGSYEYARTGNITVGFTPDNAALNINLDYSQNYSSSLAYLNYVTLNCRRKLIMFGDQLSFRDFASVGIGNVSNFRLDNSVGVRSVWDVTNPTSVKNIDNTLLGSERHFSLQTDTLREFIAFTGNNIPAPIALGSVLNQDLHALQVADMFIVSHPDFLSQANELAQFHRDCDGMTVTVVTPQQIYNEFASGAQDITAIRMFIKMFYDRAAGDPALMPKYLLLFGDASYDPLDRLSGNTNYIPTYESPNSISHTASFLSDDYYGLLDDSESMNNNEAVDIGIGRIPVSNSTDAQAMVNKVKYYSSCFGTGATATSCAVNGNQTVFGDWRTKLCFVGDDEDGNIHMGDSDIMVDSAYANAPEMNVDKLYLDAYVQESTPGGERYPEVNDGIDIAVQNGVLIMNYIGHGGEVGLAHERILDIPTINSWNNLNNMPLFMTATCEFTRYDDPNRVSAGELVYLNNNGGGIAMLTTTRLVFSGDNRELGKDFWGNVFLEPNNEPQRLGDVTLVTKVASTNGSHNHRSFALIGDPALQLAIPEHNVVTNTINGVSAMGAADTIRALSTVTITGEIQDVFGVKLTTYNGVVYPTVYDKAITITTLQNDGGSAFNFELQKNVIYKGKATVTNGDFTFTFVVPKDIIYTYDTGRISYYAVDDDGNDAHGYYENFIVGGTDTSVALDGTGPTIDLYMNDENFVNGGITDEEPTLLAKVFDENGINTVGNGIGHDIVAVLDENTSQSVVLNDYYEADLNTYKSGTVRYPFSNLSEGTHTLTFKVWDVHNNSNEAEIEFVVASAAEIALDHVLNYPNPFTTYTEFWFEHNQVCENLDVSIEIFTVAGKLVKSINNMVHTSGFKADPIEWDGRDDYGDQLAKGVYVYRLKVMAPDGSKAEKFEKLVILR